jgi:PAS domain S-box-containing protein
MISKDSRSSDAAELRIRAEEIARDNGGRMSKNQAPLSADEANRLIHELRVHQIELEMQNDELLQAQMELEASRDRYFNFYDMAPVGYFTLSEKGLILEANLTSATLLGVARSEVVKQPLSKFIHNQDQDIYYLHINQLLKTGQPQTCEVRLMKTEGALFWAHLATSCEQNSGGAPTYSVVMNDITGYKYREDERELTALLITLINTPGDFHERMSDLTTSLQGWSGCEAVGIRLKSGDDYPYYDIRGFPPEFVQAEKYLCAYGLDGKIKCDGKGNPVLECMCGNILCGRIDPAKPFFTAHGSFWSNNSTALLASTTEADRQSNTRGRCSGMGYESVALIPLRAGGQLFGLIQFNDRRPNRFTPDLIDHFEKMADTLAVALLQRQAVKALQESEEQFRNLFKYHSAVKLVIDPETGNIIDANEAAVKFYGWPLDELKRMYIQQINVLPAETVKSEMKKSVMLESVKFEFRHRKADGSICEVEVFTNKMEISGKNILYSIVQDVTERKRAEEELKASETRYRDLVEFIPAMLWATDAQGVTIDQNSKLYEYTGQTPEQSSGDGWKDIVHPDDLQHVADLWGKSTQTGDNYSIEYRIRRASDGEYRWHSVRAMLRKDQQGKPIGWFGTCIDIDDRKRAEEALRESDERLQFALETCHIGAWDLDLVDHTAYQSMEHSRIFGYTELLPQWTLEQFFQHILPEYRADVEAIIREGTAAKTGWSCESRIRRADGEIRWIWFSGRFAPDISGHSRIVGVVQDVTERKLMETYREMGKEVLQILNEPGDLKESMQRVLAILKTRTGFEAVGIRLQEGDDFPYFVQDGFPDDFLITENTLIERNAEGGVCRDEDGNVHLECTCGLVISGKADLSNPIFTRGGSCWTNDSFPHLDIPPGDDPRLHPRNLCIHKNYASCALVPIRNMDRIVGLIQINDRRKGCFTLDFVELLEGIASHIGVALMRKRVEKVIQESEKVLRASLTEKEVLLKEIHHRVKNNMQIISSLISLQSDALADERLQGVLGDVRDRVRTMALVHEKLYQAEDLSRLDFVEYVSSLLNYLWSAHGAATGNVRLIMTLAPLILSVEMAVNCGLILNELASNIIKHAFPGDSGGEVTVTLEHDPATGAVCLRVRDNGIGLPADLDWRQSPSLGLRLVQMLVGQIRGTVQTGPSPGPGTEFRISFNVKGSLS